MGGLCVTTVFTPASVEGNYMVIVEDVNPEKEYEITVLCSRRMVEDGSKGYLLQNNHGR